MLKENIIGREEEQKIFNNYLESGKSEMIAVYGRSRVGKTYLIKSFFNGKFDFAFIGLMLLMLSLPIWILLKKKR